MATTLANISIKDSSSWNTYLNLIYPVGSYYLSNSSTSPSSRFGGTWTQIKDQRFLCGYTSITTGGANSVTLTEKQIPQTWGQAQSLYYGDNSGSKIGHVSYWSSHNGVQITFNLDGAGGVTRKPTLVPHLFYVVQNCVTTLPLLEVI